MKFEQFPQAARSCVETGPKRVALLLALVVLLLGTSGCVRVDIGDHMPTVGEQLIDLYEAREIGAITEKEFERMRREVVRSLRDS